MTAGPQLFVFKAQPAVDLREALEAARDDGLDFPTAWLLAKHAATKDLGESGRSFWLKTWQDQRDVWEECYEGIGGGGSLYALMARDDDVDYSRPVRKRHRGRTNVAA